jgi:hypothetical protein
MIRQPLLALLTASALAACAGTSTANLPLRDFNATDSSVARLPFTAHADRRPTWLSSELKRALAPLLFVSDAGTDDVYIYNLPSLKLVGTITGFSQPQGECSDKKGNVWITDTNAQTIYEVSHKGHLVNELSDVTGYPAACAWDPTTGNLAVMNLFSIGSAAGSVLVYQPGSQGGRLYQNSQQFYYNFGGYDTSGNLYFDGRDASGNFMLSELPKGAKDAKTIGLTGGTIYFPGMVEWNAAKHGLIVGDQSCGNSYVSCVYLVYIAKSGGAIGTKTALENGSGGPICDLVQGVVYNGRLAGSDFDFCGSPPSATYLWLYPGGGTPLNHNASVDAVPVGAAISK